MQENEPPELYFVKTSQQHLLGRFCICVLRNIVRSFLKCMSVLLIRQHLFTAFKAGHIVL